MASEEEIEALAAVGPKMVEIIKPYRDREKIRRKLHHAENCGLLAVGIDIDHPFGPEGFHDFVDGEEMEPITTEEMRELRNETKLPFIIKGVLSVYDAKESLAAGASGILVSHHNNRIEYACPPLLVLPEILKVVDGKIPVFVDDEISTGMDAFKALALGASGVGVGRPLMTAIKNDLENGAGNYLKTMNDQLRKAMAFTGTTDLSKMDPSVIHRI
jgi:isopentenyl diphosphate isomerase/L-lactate dehydrogenase-like FMN-dependent dehydrogenase